MSRHSARILVVDDHEDNLALLRLILSAQGYAIQCARDGAQALAMIQQQPPDLILLDLMMPHISGYEVIDRVRALGDDNYIPIMLITAKQDLADKVHGLNLGADDFLTKPVQAPELIARVRALLRLKQLQDALIRERNKNALLYQVGQQLNDTLDLDRVLATTLSLTLSLVGASGGSLMLRDEARNGWRCIAAGKTNALCELPGVSDLIMTRGLAGLALRTREPQLVEDAHHDARWLRLEDDSVHVRSALALPLLRDTLELGVLTLTHEQPHRFSAEIVPLAMAVAMQVASALHNASLYTRLKEAEAAREYVVHMLTHDLRAPLAGISGCLDVLARLPHDAEADEFIGMARRACAAQAELIDDILDVYRADAGLLELVRTRFAPVELAQPLRDHLAGAAAEKQLELSIDLPARPLLFADRDKILRVLINLVSNAIKFTRRGGVWVSAQPDADGQSVVFAVRDSGVGIRPEDVGRIFDRFFRAQSVGSRRGTGLGLSFCREVVLAHGGTIWAESTPETGTVIRFSLPLRSQEHGDMDHPDR
ncbi:response regulator [Kallotenue papyrolyticum]|uniref:hybrid sensor histidine kinase/response regulator n=1 Tax=Kallotenue papyrolyticum TaxID=1325125 RepID=UPI00047866E7|nr:hybrid sensor histidine kinase/response regulator [Kallotenue papyrolyticum]